MPARYASARFVGREDAFGRLAAVLDDAAHGRARAMLVSGPAGVGISRFFDEATARIAELSEPMTVLRGGAMPAGTDEPYGPLVRAIGPALAALPDDELDAVLGPAAGRAGPAAAAAAGAARGRRPVVRRHPTRGAGAPPGPDAWRACSGCSAGSASAAPSS